MHGVLYVLMGDVSGCGLRRSLFRNLCLVLTVMAVLRLPAAEVKIFDGSSRSILYRTSVHGGHRELQELLRLVPGGERLRVIAVADHMIQPGREVVGDFPILVQRLNDNAAPPFGMENTTLTQRQMAGAIRRLDQRIATIMTRDQPWLWIGINGHWPREAGAKEGKVLLASAEVYRRWQTQNTRPDRVVLDTMSICRQQVPLTLGKDRIDSSFFARYLEGLEIVRALCARDGIDPPPEVYERVDAVLQTAARPNRATLTTDPVEDVQASVVP